MVRIPAGALYRVGYRGLALGLGLLLAAPLGAPAMAQQATPAQQPATTQTEPAAPMPVPQPSSSEPASTGQQSVPAPGSSSSSQQGDQTSGPPDGQTPAGTAAAPYEKGIGTAASRPAGAVIAPAKQHRTRTILISIGLIVGAAAAVGAVVGLSKGSPSQPAH